MLSSAQSRRILHIISVTLALLVFGYGLFLKLTKDSDQSSIIENDNAQLVEQLEEGNQKDFEQHNLLIPND